MKTTVPTYQRTRKHNRALYAAGGLTAASILGGLGYITIALDPETIFKQTYTGEGACLDGTAYDEDLGASLSSRTGAADVIDIPRDPNSQDPSILLFTVRKTGVLKHVELVPSDEHTADFLQRYNCPDKAQ